MDTISSVIELPVPILDGLVALFDANTQTRRHATRTVELWFGRLKSSSSTKRLSLIYLANGECKASVASITKNFLCSHYTPRETTFA